MGRGGDRRGRLPPRLVVALAASLVPCPPAVAAAPAPVEARPLAVPAVPYLPQSAELCGGAALAMVLRYWGAAGVRPEDFAAALLPSGRGIAAGTLARLAEERGYESLVFRGDPAEVVAQLGAGRPLIALAGDAARSSGHFVVLLAWANERVLLHDPAVGPFRVVPEQEWLDEWNSADRWTLLVLPRERRDEPGRDATEAQDDDPCDALVRPALEKADQGDLESARRDLAAAAEQCPASSAPLREMAGLAFRRENWGAAAELAERAVARRPDDALAWRLLATSRFLEGKPGDALEAWNRVGEPTLDTVSVEGLERTPFRTVYDSLGVGPEDVLTPPLLRRASRRVAALPGADGSRVSYRPLPRGRARLEVAIAERPTLAPLRPLLVESALRAVTDRDVGLSVANLTGTGDLGRVLWQWSANRPRVAVEASAPRALGLPGIVTAEVLWDVQTYRVPAGGTAGTVVREERRRASLSVEDWWTADTKAGASVALDEWSGRGRFLSIAGQIDHRLARDRVSIAASLAAWTGPSGPPFGTGALRLSARSRAAGGRGPVLRLDVAYEGASPRAPLALWPGAGTGLGRDPLLRAHPLLRDGVLDGRGFGREIVRAGLEGETAIASVGPLAITAAMFVDSARVLSPLPGTSSRPDFVDLGGGVRVHLPGRRSSLRVDVATPWGRLRPQLSVGWQSGWPH